MSDRFRRRCGTAALLLGLAALGLIALLTAVHAVGADDDLYYREQMTAGILPTAGISDEDLRMLDAALADYLSGDEDALWLPTADSHVRFTPPVEVFGTVQSAFNEREMTHMRDCYDLFALLRKVRSRLIPWAVLLIVGGAYALRDRRRIRFAAWVSPVILLAPLGLFALFALIDFDAAFNGFHRLLFRNDLWLLDPRTDLLIRICPQTMFMHMGAHILMWSLLVIFGAPALAALLTRLWPKGKEESTWNNRTVRRASAQKRLNPAGRMGAATRRAPAKRPTNSGRPGTR